MFNNKDDQEYKSLIAMILDEKETARRLARKLYRWFVYYIIDEDIEANIIEPLATTLIDNNYDIKPILEQLLNCWGNFDGARPPAHIVPLEPGQEYQIRRNLFAFAFATRRPAISFSSWASFTSSFIFA